MNTEYRDNQMNRQNIKYCPQAFIIVINVRGYYGIRGLANHWFAFYISDRKQYTSINGFNSDLTNIYGVPKGSVQGSHLFFTYISGLLRAIKYSKVHHFADDASLNFSSSIKLIKKQVNNNIKSEQFSIDSGRLE